MITVEYKILQDEKDQVIDTFTKSFQTDEDRREYEQSQLGHPFLTLRSGKVTITEGDDNA